MERAVDCRRQQAGTRTGTGTAPGSFGELVQGVLPGDDLDFLVTLPINRGTRASFRPEPDQTGVTVWPAHKVKARRLAEVVLAGLRIGCGGTLRIDSDLLEGKGFASSSADLVATAHAVADAFGWALTPSAVESFMRGIEPSDGVMYQGSVAYYHRAVQLRQTLGFLPPLVIVAYDEGGTVDTVQFNRLPQRFDRADKLHYAELLAQVSAAIPAGDLAAVGAAATQSAIMNGKLRSRPAFESVHRVCRDSEAIGVVIAHSGTVMGLLLAADDPALSDKLRYGSERLGRLPGTVSVHHSLCSREPAAAATAPVDPSDCGAVSLALR
jgi:L-threonine kinase